MPAAVFFAAAACAFSLSAKVTAAATAASALRTAMSALAAFARAPSTAVFWQEPVPWPFQPQFSQPMKSIKLIYVK